MWTQITKTILYRGDGGKSQKTESRPMTSAEEKKFDAAMKKLDDAMSKLDEAFRAFP